MHFADYLFAKSNLEKEGEKFYLFIYFFFQCEACQNKLKKLGVLGLPNTPVQKFYSLCM